MNLLQFFLIQLNLCLFFGIYFLLISGKKHRSINRWYLLLMPFIAIGLPFISLSGIETELNWIQELPMISVLQANTLVNPVTTIHWEGILYISGIALFVGFTVYQLIKVLHRPIATYYKTFNGSRVYLLKENKASYSFFNRIYLNPQQLANEEIVLLHEHAHCKDLHSIDLLILAILKALLWFNPIIHLWDKRVRENHEYIADQYVLSHQQSASEYGRVLLEATFNTYTPVFVSAFSMKSLLHKRIDNLKHKNQYHMKHLIIVPVVAGLAFLSTSMNTPVEGAQTVVKSTSISTDQEKPAEFPGGQEALFAFIHKEIKYPKDLANKGIEGVVYISFEISKNGKIENAEVIRGSSHDALDAEALRVVRAMPNWNPATKGGKAVRSSMKLPFKFAL